ncbi:MAG: Isoquinoline 1-oxidoreductase subunit, partial [Steroidobacteraceae bacterium]
MTRTSTLLAAVAALLLAVACAAPPASQESAAPVAPNELRAVETFSSIRDRRARAVALFEEAGKVLQHPRCVNCHPAGDRPLQTDRGQPHMPMVVRGTDG